MPANTLRNLASWAWIVLALALAGAVYMAVDAYRTGAAYKVERDAFETRLRASELKIAEKTSEASKAAQEAAQERANADLARQAGERARADLAAAVAARQVLQARLAAMTPGEVVQETIRRLNLAPGDVTQSSLGYTFTLVAGKKNLGRLTDADHYEFSVIPAFKDLVIARDKEIEGLRGTVTAQDSQIGSLNAIIGEYKKIQVDYSAILKKSEHQANVLKWTFRGVGTAVVIGGLIAILGN